jgi:hypothetical protein
MITTRRILKEIGCQHLRLYNGGGYWYFTYDDGHRYRTHSVLTIRLNDLPLTDWVAEGRDLVATVEAKG